MDNFERRLAASMKIAGVQRPDVEPESINSNRSNKSAGFMTLTAAVLIGAVIAGTTWLFNPSDSATPADVSPSGVINLEGEWVLSELNDPEGKRVVDSRTGCAGCLFPESGYAGPEQKFGPVSLKFSESDLTIESQGKCRFTAHYSQSGNRGSDLRFSSEAGFFIEMDGGCTVEKALYSSLPDVRQASETDGVLRLQSEGGSTIATLERVPTEPTNIEGKWRVIALTDAEGQSALRGPYAQTLRLSFLGGRLGGQTGCNKILGNYEQGGDSGRDLELANVWETEGVCPYEPPLRDRLEDVRHVSEVDGKLQLQAENWMTIVVLERDAPTGQQTPASAQNPPRRLNMQVVRQVGASQQFRAYTGPQPPPTSEAEAVRSVQGDEVYSLGLHDIGFVHYSGSVEWQSVWIIASDTFKPDINGGGIGRGPMALGPDGDLVPVSGTPIESTEPESGWARSVTMIDAVTGKELMSLSF